MNIFITGGAGYIGSILTELLLQQPFINKVTVLDNLTYRQTSLTQFCRNPKFQFILGDVRDRLLLKTEASASDVVIPLAALVGFPICDREAALATAINYQQIEDLISFGQAHKIIYPNTNSGYGINADGVCTEESPLRPISHYGETKVKAEALLLATGDAISLRLATVFGVSPRMRLDLLVNDFTFRAVRDGYIVLFEKDFKRNYIHVRDVADAFLFMIQNRHACRGQAYNVGLSNANLSKLELAELIKRHVPNFVIEINDFKSDPDQRNYIVSNEKIESLGWRPHIGLETGVQELVQAHIFYNHSLKNNYSNQ